MPTPPRPQKRPFELSTHGITRSDPYYWLNEKDNPEVLAHLEAENAFVEASFADQKPLREALYQEIIARIEQTDLSVPYRRGPFWYYERTVEGLSYSIVCRRPAGPLGEQPPMEFGGDDEEVIFDENIEANGALFFATGNLAVSPDHAWLAYATETEGDERYRLRFRRLADGYEAPETIQATYYGLAWANDSATVFYTRVDEAMRPFQVWRHTVGTEHTTDALVLEELDAKFFLSIGKTKDARAIVIHLGSKTTSECWLIDPSQPLEAPVIVQARRQGIEYAVEHHHGSDGVDRLLIITNDGAEDFTLLVQPRKGGTPVEVIPNRPGTRIDDVDAFATFLVVTERLDAERRLRILPIPDGSTIDHETFDRSWLVDAPASPSTTWEAENPEFTSTSLRFGQTSLVTPSRVAEIDVSTHRVNLLKTQVVRGEFDAAKYATTRLWATATDGTEIPISVVWRSDGAGPEHGPSPTLLYGYGSYEHSVDPTFSSLRLSLLDRGVVFAIAHVRGGGELGRRWYEEGKFNQKATTFTDFLACAHHLIDHGWTDPNRLVARGASAGGLLMGAIANLEPETFTGIVAEVPFVDCVTTMLDETLPLTIGEYEEWGNPSESESVFRTMLSYAPYDNVTSTNLDGSPRRYPRMFVTSGLNDTRVGYFEPAKWVAKLREANVDNEVYFRTELGAGHGGPSGRYDSWADEALVYTFILTTVGLV